MTRAHADDPNQLDVLLAMLEHEARTPLSAIVGFAELLRADMSQAELIDTVQR
jgi:signal transduction histidine kinase